MIQPATSLILTLICGLAAAFFAQDRGRDPVNWYFIGLFLGIYSLPALFIMRPLKK